MPYRVEKRSGRKPWAIVRVDTGGAVGFSETKAKALASIRAREAAERRTRAPKPRKKWWSL